MSKPEGYRYVRQYRVKSGASRWALYETQQERARRVGTASKCIDYLRFLRFSEE